MGAEGVVMDGLDAVSVGEAVAVAGARPDAIVHQRPRFPWRTPASRYEAHGSVVRPHHPAAHRGTDHLLPAAAATGVSDLVAQGYASWNGIREGGSVKTEQDPLDLEEGTAAHAGMEAIRPAPASEWLPYLAACAGAKRPMRIPKWLARLLAGEAAVVMMTEGRGFSNAKANRELGWQLHCPPWRQGFKEGLA
jgi:hypothetical protein